jgi:hypothetical protein
MLDTLANFRDLGALPTVDGGATRRGVLCRSDAPLTGDRRPDAPSWPPALVLDLRSADEPVTPHALDLPGTTVRRIPLMAEARPGTFHTLQAEGTLSLDGLYSALVQRTAAILPEVLELMLATRGATLVHCTAGKDRTGVVVAVLLAAAGVTRAAIVEDYCLTGTNMERIRPRMPPADQQVTELSAGFTTGDAAPAATISTALDLLDRAGGVERWFDAAGIRPAVHRAWRARMVA